MNILVSKYSVDTVSLIIAYLSLYPEERTNCKVLGSWWTCRTLRHMIYSAHPVLDNETVEGILEFTEPMSEILPGLYASEAHCSKLKELVNSDFTHFALCVNPQLFKLMEMSV